MDEYRLSAAMNDLPDDLLLEAAQKGSKRRTRPWLLRAAACFAIVIGLLTAALGLWPSNDGIITGPGILAVTAYAADEKPFSISSPDMVLHKSIYWDVASSSSFVFPIHLSVSDEYHCSEDINFQITIDGGGMIWEQRAGTATPGTSYEYMPAHFAIPNHSMVCWSTFHPNAASDEYSMVNRNAAHVDVVIYDGEEIVGYAVLRLTKMTCSEVIQANPEWIFASEHKYCAGEHKVNCYRIEMLESIYFPKIDGEYQAVEEEYVCEQIEKAKQR